MSVDARANIIPKTPEATLMAAQTYLLATQPAVDDPRADMHHSALARLGLVGATLIDKEAAP
jgi:hypothetical protein